MRWMAEAMLIRRPCASGWIAETSTVSRAVRLADLGRSAPLITFSILVISISAWKMPKEEL